MPFLRRSMLLVFAVLALLPFAPADVTAQSTKTFTGSATVRTLVSEPAVPSIPIRPRTQHTATKLADGSVLFVGGRNGASFQQDFPVYTERYIPASNAFVQTAALLQRRTGHAAVRLQDGRVLVVGGYRASTGTEQFPTLASAELYDPTRDRWVATGNMTTPRRDITATLLPNGKVLVTGGGNKNGVLASAELYDPATGTWSSTGSMSRSYFDHTATLLKNGTVLIFGGSAETYDPATGLFTPTGPVQTQRYQHTASLLLNGDVLIAGGVGSASAERYNPMARTFQSTGPMSGQRSSHSANVLSDGSVLVAGGSSLPTSERYDPAANTWVLVGNMVIARTNHTATLLPNNDVLVMGGTPPTQNKDRVNDGLRSAERYNPTTRQWAITGIEAQGQPSVLPDGTVLLLDLVPHIYDPATKRVTETTAPHVPRYAPSVTLADKRVMIVGGYSGATPRTLLYTTEIYDPETRTWTETDTLRQARTGGSLTLLANGKVLAAGGTNDNYASALATTEIYDPANDTWRATGALNRARFGQNATLLKDGTVLVTGGASSSTMYSSTSLKTAERYNPTTGVWTRVGDMNLARHGHGTVLLPNGKVLVAGGTTGSTPSSTAELFDPATNRFTPTSAMVTQSGPVDLTLLPDGIVAVSGGVEVYDSARGTFEAVVPPNGEAAGNVVRLLPNGTLLVVRSTRSLINTVSVSKRFTGSLTVPAGWVTTSTPTVTFTVATEGATLDAVSLNGGPWIAARPNTPTTTTLPPVVDGRDVPVDLRVRDRSGLIRTVATGTIDVDATAPTSTMTALSSTTPSPVILQWSGQDATSGIAGYDVHVRDGASGTWTPYVRNSTAQIVAFNGTSGHTYYFRLRARDVAGNVETFSATYDTMTTISP